MQARERSLEETAAALSSALSSATIGETRSGEIGADRVRWAWGGGEVGDIGEVGEIGEIGEVGEIGEIGRRSAAATRAAAAAQEVGEQSPPPSVEEMRAALAADAAPAADATPTAPPCTISFAAAAALLLSPAHPSPSPATVRAVAATAAALAEGSPQRLYARGIPLGNGHAARGIPPLPSPPLPSPPLPSPSPATVRAVAAEASVLLAAEVAARFVSFAEVDEEATELPGLTHALGPTPSAVEGAAVEGTAVEGTAVEGTAVEGTAEEGAELLPSRSEWVGTPSSRPWKVMEGHGRSEWVGTPSSTFEEPGTTFTKARSRTVAAWRMWRAATHAHARMRLHSFGLLLLRSVQVRSLLMASDGF